MAARKRAPCTHPAHKVDLVYCLGTAFTVQTARGKDATTDEGYQTHAINWCSECGAISRYETLRGGKVREVWRLPRLSEGGPPLPRRA